MTSQTVTDSIVQSCAGITAGGRGYSASASQSAGITTSLPSMHCVCKIPKEDLCGSERRHAAEERRWDVLYVTCSCVCVYYCVSVCISVYCVVMFVSSLSTVLALRPLHHQGYLSHFFSVWCHLWPLTSDRSTGSSFMFWVYQASALMVMWPVLTVLLFTSDTEY